MAQKVVMTFARVGRAADEDLRALFCLVIGLALAGAPLLLWQMTARHLFRDVFLQLPPPLVLASLALAISLSGAILHRLYRLPER